MKNFFLASDLSPHLEENLNKQNFGCEYARAFFLNTIAPQIEHCVSNNLVMITKNKKMFRLCRHIRHPVIWLKGNDGEDEILGKIEDYLREVKILQNAA